MKLLGTRKNQSQETKKIKVQSQEYKSEEDNIFFFYAWGQE